MVCKFSVSYLVATGLGENENKSAMKNENIIKILCIVKKYRVLSIIITDREDSFKNLQKNTGMWGLNLTVTRVALFLQRSSF